MSSRNTIPERRIRPGVPLQVGFCPSFRPDRISLAWIDSREEAVFVPGPHGLPSTVVVVWPTDQRGRMLADALTTGRVAVWELTPTFWDAMGPHLAVWSPGRFDIRTTTASPLIYPWPRTGRLWSGFDGTYGAQIDRLCRSLG